MKFVKDLALIYISFLFSARSGKSHENNNQPIDYLGLNEGHEVPLPTPTRMTALAPLAVPTSISKSRSPLQKASLKPSPVPTLLRTNDQCRLSEDSLAPQANGCVARYHNPLATTVSGAKGLLPTPRAFIRKDGNVLKASSSVYRPVGPNIYWLGLDENEGRRIAYPSRSRVREAFAAAAAMGANTVRSISLGVSVGHPLSVWPVKGETNEDAFQAIDYAIGTARQYGIRLIIPLTDNYRFYHGGKYTFLSWEGINTTDADAESNFYRNDDVIDSFKAYIEVILTHINQYTGIAYKDDPTILAWETGNELGAFDLEQGAPPGSWTNEIARHIKSIDNRHLVIDGSDGIFDSDGDDIDGLDVDAIDIVSDHLYRMPLTLTKPQPGPKATTIPSPTLQAARRPPSTPDAPRSRSRGVTWHQNVSSRN